MTPTCVACGADAGPVGGPVAAVGRDRHRVDRRPVRDLPAAALQPAGGRGRLPHAGVGARPSPTGTGSRRRTGRTRSWSPTPTWTWSTWPPPTTRTCRSPCSRWGPASTPWWRSRSAPRPRKPDRSPPRPRRPGCSAWKPCGRPSCPSSTSSGSCWDPGPWANRSAWWPTSVSGSPRATGSCGPSWPAAAAGSGHLPGVLRPGRARSGRRRAGHRAADPQWGAGPGRNAAGPSGRSAGGAAHHAAQQHPDDRGHRRERRHPGDRRAVLPARWLHPDAGRRRPEPALRRGVDRARGPALPGGRGGTTDQRRRDRLRPCGPLAASVATLEVLDAIEAACR